MAKRLNEHCECELAGFCQRHGIEKNDRQFALCKGRGDENQCAMMWNAWEAGAIDGQTNKPDSPIAKPEQRQTVGSQSQGQSKGCGKSKKAREKRHRFAAVEEATKCVHRGEKTREVKTTGCGSPRSLEPVFKCELHGECTLRKTRCTTKENLPGCLVCDDRKAPEGDEAKLAAVPARIRQRPFTRSVKQAKSTGAMRRKKQGGFPIKGGSEWISWEKFARDTMALAAMLPPNLSAVAGVARSGLFPATALAMHLHLPLFSLTKSQGLINPGCGWRIGDRRPKDGPILVVDDTTFRGSSLKMARRVMAERHPQMEAIFAVIYRNPRSRSKPDLYVETLHDPHFLEWNIFNSVYTPMMAVDFDGILCRNPRDGEYHDGSAYRKFLETAEPLYLPRKGAIPLIVTARLEKYRAVTEEWLRRWDVICHKLVMGPWSSDGERAKAGVAKWKAECVKSAGVSLYVESEPPLAEAIARLSHCPVLCPRVGKVF